jgi:hypothetical protein
MADAPNLGVALENRRVGFFPIPELELGYGFQYSRVGPAVMRMRMKCIAFSEKFFAQATDRLSLPVSESIQV